VAQTLIGDKYMISEYKKKKKVKIFVSLPKTIKMPKSIINIDVPNFSNNKHIFTVTADK
jgi:hypothetical protein